MAWAYTELKREAKVSGEVRILYSVNPDDADDTLDLSSSFTTARCVSVVPIEVSDGATDSTIIIATQAAANQIRFYLYSAANTAAQVFNDFYAEIDCIT